MHDWTPTTTTSPFLQSCWVTRRGRGELERVLPNGRAQVVVDLNTGRAVLVGPRTMSAVVTPPAAAAGFALSGAGLGAILGPDAGALVDDVVELDQLHPRVEIRITDPDDVRLTAALRWIAAELVNRFPIDGRIVSAESAIRSGWRASQAAASAGMDRRRFVPLFRRTVGMSPKRYERVIRFQTAVRCLRTAPERSIADIAATLGYADQAHLTREVRAFGGVTLAEIQGSGAGPMNHMPLDLTSAASR
jgi:AraC-like DNA-binding protein